MREIVQMAEARVPDRTPSQLVGDRNACTAKDVQRPRNRGGFETFDIAIVARCGDREVTRVWDSPEHVLKSAPGLWETLDDRSIEDDLALQHAGESVIGELRSGRFDKGLAKVERLWKKPSFNAVLSRYTGPVPDNPLVAKLMNASDFRFVQFVAPKYPPLAGHAHVQGKVELRLGVDSATGAVLEAEIAAGHPLFRPAVLDAAKQWRFEPGSTSSAVNAVLEFSLDCR